MAEKIKVTREVADAIEFQLKVKNHDIDRLIASHASHKLGRGHFMCRSAILDEMSVSQFASVLINGYKVEETPEEKVAKYYRSLKLIEGKCEYAGASGSQFRQGWQSVEKTLNLLGLKIEGVNA